MQFGKCHVYSFVLEFPVKHKILGEIVSDMKVWYFEVILEILPKPLPFSIKCSSRKYMDGGKEREGNILVGDFVLDVKVEL